jgi:Cys-rich four helix bundle protein (predicted Tat secretion target)
VKHTGSTAAIWSYGFSQRGRRGYALSGNAFMQRRVLIEAAGLVALATVSAQAMAQTAADPHAHHHGSGGPSALTTAASECVTKGEACLSHCLVLLGQGDKDMAACAQSVNQLLASCGSLAKVSAQGGSQLNALARVSANVCEECEKECRKHEKKHAECKACAESCAECAKQCKLATA